VTVELRLPSGLTVRPATEDDAEAILALVGEAELADQGERWTDLDDIRGSWARPTFDLARDTLLVFQDVELAGGTEVSHGYLDGYVHPAHRGRGIGGFLLDWAERRAVQLGYDRIGQSVPESLAEAHRLFASHGFARDRTSWVLTIDLDRPFDPPSLPDGIELRDVVPGEERAVHAVIERAFNEWPDRLPTTFEEWSAFNLARSTHRPELLPVLVDGEEVVGVALCIDGDPVDGWIQQVAVARPYRGRGLGRALLVHAFRRFQGMGKRTCSLGTDTRTGALGMYERVGMRVRNTYAHFGKRLPSTPDGRGP
jgi:GNAT superfamily N-acetyltransferase